MITALPNLDDRRWTDLVEEGRALIPAYAPQWTDHNVHDPGITLMELLASIAEMDIYQLNRIPDLHLRKFLQLAGIDPRPPQPAATLIGFRLAAGSGEVLLPQGIELAQRAATDQEPAGFRTLAPVAVQPVEMQAVCRDDGSGLADVSAYYAPQRWRTGKPASFFSPDGPDTQALYMGFHASHPVAAGAKLHLCFLFSGGRSGAEERQRLLEELRRSGPCTPPKCRDDCHQRKPSRKEPAASVRADEPLLHHSAELIWEYWDGGMASWQPLAVEDDTRALTLDGCIIATIPAGWAPRQLGPAAGPLFYIRCRRVRGKHDAPVVIAEIVSNGAAAEQAVPVHQTWKIAAQAQINGTPPAPAESSGLEIEFDGEGRVVKLSFVETEPRFVVLEFEKSPGAEGKITLELVSAGPASGAPGHRATLKERPVLSSSLRLFTLEPDGFREWSLRSDLVASVKSDEHYLLNPTEGFVHFGNGDRGRVPPAGARIFVSYAATLAESGNVPAHTSFTLDDSPRNRALLGDVHSLQPVLPGIVNPAAAAGGQAAETLEHAIGRAIKLREAPLRAVTLNDFETLARETPGTRIARATAHANLHPAFDCYRAPGMIAVLIVPASDSHRPMPSRALRETVRRYLERRRVIGMRVEVFGPQYLDVAVRAGVKAFANTDPEDVRQRVIEALNRFLHPLHGGPDGTGWPFGRDVYRSEVLQVIDQTDGVDHVLSLALVVANCKPQCGNVCLGPNWLVAAGPHEIEVIRR